MPEETQHDAAAATCPQACPWLTSNPEIRTNSALFVKPLVAPSGVQVLAGTILHWLCAQISQMRSVRGAPSLFSWMLLGLVITKRGCVWFCCLSLAPTPPLRSHIIIFMHCCRLPCLSSVCLPFLFPPTNMTSVKLGPTSSGGSQDHAAAGVHPIK